MIDFLKDFFESVGQRIRSPILESISFFFLVCNWQPLFYLFFADESVATRLGFFNIRTDLSSLYLYPIGLGLLFSLLILPWSKVIGTWAAAAPRQIIKKIEFTAVTELKILEIAERAKERMAAEQAEIEFAKRVDEVRSGIQDDDLKVETEQKLRVERLRDKSRGAISNAAWDILSGMANSDNGLLIQMEVDEYENGSLYGLNDSMIDVSDSHRNSVEFKAALEELVRYGSIEDLSEQWRITKEGFDYYDSQRNLIR